MILPVWKKAGLNPFRIFIPNGTAIDVRGFNRYTGQPVNSYGLTYEADLLRVNILDAFPASPTKHNYAVDRAIGHSTNPNAALSDHARGEALDWMIAKFDGKSGISDADRAYGQAVFDWIVARMTGPVNTGLRGISYQGPFRVNYVIFNHYIHYAIEGRTRRLKPTSMQHTDHVHVSIVPIDRRDLPVLVEKMTGADVKKLQLALNTDGRVPLLVVDGQFGPKTLASLKAWQAKVGLAVDGTVDADDWLLLPTGKN